MAKAKVNKSGTGVTLRMSFREAAALKALLQRIGLETNAAIDEATCDVWSALDLLRDDVDAEDDRLWPSEFDEFGEMMLPLVDPEVPCD